MQLFTGHSFQAFAGHLFRSNLKPAFRLVALLCTMLASHQLNAQQLVTYKEELSGAAGSLAVDSNRTVMDSAFFAPGDFPGADTTWSIYNMITFSVDETSITMPPDSFKVELTLRIYFTNGDGIYDSIASKVLNIDYRKTAAYNNKAIFYFNNARSVKIRVLAINVLSGTLATFLPLLKVENRMVINRVLSMNCTNDAVKTVTAIDSVSSKGILIASWGAANPAQEYDLEWTFIDQAALDAGWYNTSGVPDPEKIFRNNATRVSIVQTMYKIPMLYDGDGKIFFRVRGAQMAVNGQRYTTAWSSGYVAQGGLGQYTYTGHERKLNWQATTSFAEEGKRKSVVQYFDGTLRSRQTVTKDNITDTTIVAETFYDKQGRSVIEVLPAPSLTALIKYNTKYNVYGVDTEYTKNLYDTLYSPADYCSLAAPPMDSVSGASKYYSYNNQNKLVEFNKYIPQALEYPFTQVKYTQDNTGRISGQSGVSPVFKLGTGHETKYYYGTPEQSDLDALFGTEAGYASHYQKNMVRDANGQYSVSYIDMHGRTVATALAGKVPAGLQALSSKDSTTQTDALITRSNNVIKGNSIESVKGLIVTKAGPHTFTYKLNPESLKLLDKNNVEICYDCLYDLTITITDDCNNQNLPGQQPYVFRDSNMRVAPPIYDTLCTNKADTFATSFTITLPEGSYMIAKKLSLREDARNWYRDSLYAPHNTVKTKQQVIQEQLAAIRSQRTGCEQDAEPRYAYENYHEQMLMDMTPPYGQYAKWPVEADKNIMSIFAPLSNGKYLYQDVNYNITTGLNPASLSPNEFVQNFQPEWAEYLVRARHPERTLLAKYEAYTKSDHWDADFEATETYQQAYAKGYLNPTNNVAAPGSAFGNGNDSLFYGGANGDAKTSLNASLSVYKTVEGNNYSLWAMASALGHCDTRNQGCLDSFRTTTTNLFNAAVMCEGERDMAWRFFRNEYLRLKRKWINDNMGTVTLDEDASPVFMSEQYATDKGGDLFSTDLATAQQAAKDSIASVATQTCTAYAVRWWEQLASCNYNATDSLKLIPRLIEICKRGSDSTHPFGASSIAPGNAYTFNSFDELIAHYNDSTGKPNDAACNAFLIDAPGPYNKPMALVNIPAYGKPDSCTCDKISSLYNQYQNAVGYSDFSDYVQQKLHTTITQNALDSLRNLCNGTINCRYILSPVIIPPALQCSTGYDVCVDCNQVNSVYNQFKTSYPGIIPGYADTTAQQQQYNELFKKYMNNKLGFSKTTLEYLVFMDSCGATISNTCDSLQNLVTNYRQIDSTCTTGEFTTYFNQQNGTSYVYEQIDSVYFNTCGRHIEACGDLTISKGSLEALASAFNLVQNPYRGRITLQSNILNPPLYVTAGEQMISNGYLHWPKEIRDSTGKGWVYYHQLTSGSPMCVENGYSFEFRFKSLKKMSGADDVYYVQGGNIDFVLYRREGGSQPGFFLRTILERGTSPHTVVSSGLVLMDSDPDIIFKEWCTIKATVTPTHFRIYYNGNLVKEAERPVGFTWLNTVAFTHCFYDYQGIVDWFKTYDGNDNLVYFEDFNDPYSRAAYDPGFICATPVPSCGERFATYYNQQKGTAYTFSQIDSVYTAAGLVLDVCGLDTSTVRCDQLDKYVDLYKQQYVTPASGYVDLDMRTFAGNKTPDEGPKGVFDINGKLLGNTVDSTATAIKESYVSIWNNSADNRAVGTLSLLQSGKFRLMLNPGKQAPCEGIIGQRYYQVDAYTNELDGLVTGTGTYIDFGDSTSAKVNDLDSNAVTVTTSLSFLQPATSTRVMPDYVNVYSYYTTHVYSANPTHKIVTIYHSDFKGRVGFDCYASSDCGIYSNIRNLRGYFPQELRDVYFHTTHDSTLNNFSQIRNFDQITTLQSFSFSGHSSTGFRNNRLPDFKNSKNLKAIAIENDPAVPIAQIRPIEEYLPGININYPQLSAIVIRPYDSSFAHNLHFNIPSLRTLSIQNSYIGSSYTLTTENIDQIINEVASSVVNDSGNLVILPYGSTVRSAASDSAVTKLISKKWRLIGAGMNNDVPFATFSTLVMPDTTKWFSSFSDYINNKLGTDFTLRQIDSLYLARCGHKPDCCSAPDTSLPSNLLLCGKNEPSSPVLQLSDIYDPPCSDSSTLAYNKGTEVYNAYKDSLDQGFNKKYNAKCLSAAAIEQFTVRHEVSEYHYTLYYYDQAGNLIKTVPPAGVHPNRDSLWLLDVAQKRDAMLTKTPVHDMPTVYRYNSLNQVVSQQTPDGGKSSNWYDRLGRLAVSRNAKQQAESRYSYTLYDHLGRITEVGQKYQTTAMTNTLSRNPVSLENWIYYNDGSNHYPAEMVTQTIYDVPGIDATACVESLRFTQKPHTLRNRVSYTRTYEKPSYYYDAVAARYYISPATFTTGIDYSYDIHGNVDTMRNLYGTVTYGPMAHHGYNACKTIAYTYDLISGKVNQVHYNPGQNDEFYHRYAYDAENRLTHVYTTDTKSFIGIEGLEDREAMYTYYRHGPLARTMLGQGVQGIDYAYTLQGWLKGVNSTNVYPYYDVGGDGTAGNTYNATDAYSFTLHYFDGDYKSINYTVSSPFAEPKAYFPSGEYRPLYNGNISSMAHSIPARFFYQLYNYQYDQLNRLVGMDMYRGLVESTNKWSSLAVSTLYKERYTYDPNGNITKVFRNGHLSANALMDSLRYFYKAGTNQLDYIRDRNNGSASHSNNYGATADIKDQASGNYVYNAIGELNYDRISSIDSIKWNVYGKMQHIYKHAATYGTAATGLHYYYDPSGNRVGRAVLYNPSTSYNSYTWYVRDAQGNVLATYRTIGSDITTSTLKLIEHHMYGSSRLGIINRDMDVDQPRLTADNSNAHLGTAYLSIFTRGNKLFELTNHLGNVLVTVTDVKTPTPKSGTPSQVGGYTANMVVATDYTPFGMIMQGRNYNNAAGDKYRYGFNGQEYDNSIKGTGNHFTAEFWEYDPRVGRRWNLDPKPNASIGGYSAFTNNPILFSDPHGDTIVTGAGGTQTIDIDERVHALEFYEKGVYTAGGKQVLVQPGQLRSITNSFGTYKAKWNTSGAIPVFVGYSNDKGETIEQAAERSERNAKISAAFDFSGMLLRWADDNYQESQKDAVGWSVKFSTNLLVGSAMSAIDPIPLGNGYNPSTTLREGAGELETMLAIAAKGVGNYAYRSLTSANAESLAAGKGIFAKAPGGSWTLEQHLIHGSSPKSFLNNPWIATSSDINVARSFSSGNGLIRIDLSKISANSMQRGWMNLPRSSAGYHYSIWQQEVSIFGHIPQNAIKIIK